MFVLLKTLQTVSCLQALFPDEIMIVFCVNDLINKPKLIQCSLSNTNNNEKKKFELFNEKGNHLLSHQHFTDLQSCSLIELVLLSSLIVFIFGSF